MAVKEAIHSRGMNPSLNETVDVTLPLVWNNTKERLAENRAGTINGQGPGLRNSVSVPVKSPTPCEGLHHTDKGCSDSPQVCKLFPTLSRGIQ